MEVIKKPMGGFGSGRKVSRERLQGIDKVMKLSLRTVNQFLSDDSISIERKASIATQFALKRIPDTSLIKAEINDVSSMTNDRKERLVEAFKTLMTQRKTIDVRPTPE